MADMEAACQQLDMAVSSICTRHDPVGCLPFVLALSTGAIVAGVAARSARWYFAVLLSLGGAALMWIVLMIFRVVSWSRHHPLLAEMYKLQHLRRGNEDADFDLIELSEAIVRHYLPEQSVPILASLADAKRRAAVSLGLDDYEPSSPSSSSR